MSWQDKDEYLEEIIGQVKFFFDHESIEKELTVHLEERKEDYISEGYAEKEAEELTITNFGDPVEIGKALNKEHSPLLGWLYYITNTIVGITVIYFVFAFILPFGMIILDRNPARTIPEEDILYRIDVDEKVKIDDRIIKFDEVIYEKNGDMNIIYKQIDTSFNRMGWGLGSIGTIMDETGKDYFIGSGFSSFSKGLWTLHSFPKDAKKLIIEYDFYNRYYKVEVPLKAGGAHE